MKICILSKFPPLQGGISAKTYWLACAYAKEGHNVHVVSNANLTEKVYTIPGCYPHIQRLEGVTIHEVDPDLPWHIPNEPHSLARLVDTALQVVKQHEIDVIDTGYMVPYGIAGYLVHQIAGVPYVLRHGGSDIEKFLLQGRYSRLLEETVANAEVVITDQSRRSLFEKRCKRMAILPPYVPTPDFFSPLAKGSNRKVRILFLGKINWHWQRKGLELIGRCVKNLPKDWEMQLIGGGKGKARLRQSLRDEGITGLQIRHFIPPWEVPSIMQKADFVCCLRVAEPIESFSNLVAEALACGSIPVVADDFDTTPYLGLFHEIDTSILRVNVNDVNSFMSVLIDRHTLADRNQETPFSYMKYIRSNLTELENAVPH